MPPIDMSPILCPACKKNYEWKPSLAGKSMKCSCGGNLKFPAPPPPPPPTMPAVGYKAPPPLPPQSTYAAAIAAANIGAPPSPPRSAPPTYPPARPADQAYDFAPQPLAPVAGRRCPACSSPLMTAAILCTNCGFNIQTGRRLGTKIKTGPDMGEVAVQVGVMAGKTILALIVGAITAAVCGFIWGWIGLKTRYEFQYIAIGVGFVTGLAMRIVTNSGGLLARFAAAFFAVLGILIGKAIFLVNNLQPFYERDFIWIPIAAFVAWGMASQRSR